MGAHALKLLLLAAGIASAQLVGTAPPPRLSEKGLELIYEFEISGAGHLPNGGRPEWPGYASGTTWGVGFDGGYNSKAVILSDWAKQRGVERLAETSGITGSRAKALIPALRDIIVKWDLASEVFDRVTVGKFYGQTARAFPGMTGLRPNAQAALVSLVFNRGPSLIGPRREEMRDIRTLVTRQDYGGIADAIRRMKPLWRGTAIQAGMYRRRDAEARLVLTP